MDGLLDPVPAPIGRLAGQEGHLEGFHDRDWLGELMAVADLIPVSRSIATTSMAITEPWVAGQPGVP